MGSGDFEGNFEIPFEARVETEGGEAQPVERTIDVEVGQLQAAAAFAGRAQGADSFDVAEVDGAQRASHVLNRAAQQPSLDRHRQFVQQPDLQQYRLAVVREQATLQTGEFGGPVGLFVLRPGGGGCENIRQSRIQSDELRHEIEADPVAEEHGVGVRGILSPEDVTAREGGADVVPPEGQQGPHDAPIGDGPDAAQTSGARAAQETRHQRLRLVVEGVACRDRVAGSGGDAGFKERIPGAPRLLLDVAFGHGRCRDFNGKAQFGGQSPNKRLIPIGFGAPQPMVDVQDDGGQARVAQGVQQKDRVGASGDSDTDPSAEPQHGVAGDRGPDCLLQTHVHSQTYLMPMNWIPIALAAGLLAGQESPPTSGPSVSIKVDVSLINVAFIVRYADEKLSRDLTRDDIEVFEDGVKQEVRYFGRSDDLPLRLGVVMDVSGSQEKFNRQHRRDLETFLRKAVTGRDCGMLVCFGNHVRVVSGFTGSVSGMMEALDRFQKGDRHFPELEPDETRSAGTALFDAMYLTAGAFAAAPRPQGGERKALILFSDGEDNSSAHDLPDAIEAAQAADALIYTVRYTESKKGQLTARNRYGIREMDRLAAETGGAAFDASRRDVGTALAQVGEELRSLYEVGYMSSNPVRDGTFRKVLIRVKRDGMTVRAKPGYYARDFTSAGPK